MTARRVLLLLDATTLPHLVDGELPRSPYSHDQNAFQFAHELLRRGWRVAVAPAHGDPATRPAREVAAVYPAWQQAAAGCGATGWAPDIVVSVHPEALNLRGSFPEAKLVAIHAAIHWVENPQAFPAQYVFDLITAVRYNIDFIVTQNARMAELLGVAYALLARWPHRDRVLVAPLGLVAEQRRDLPPRDATRAQLGLATQDVAIVNAGGVWRWTDFNTLLAAFGAHHEARPASPLRLFVMGLLQPANTDHAAYVAETEALLYRFRALLGGAITVHNHWDDAARRVLATTAAADLGLNVNQDLLENWQSFRLRLLDYMAAGLPVLQTRGDLLSEAGEGAHAFLVRPGDVADYRRVLDAIATDRGLLAEPAAAMRVLARSFDSQATYGAVLDQIERMPRRRDGDHAGWGDCVLDYAAAHVRTELRGRLHAGLGRLAEGLLEG